MPTRTNNGFDQADPVPRAANPLDQSHLAPGHVCILVRHNFSVAFVLRRAVRDVYNTSIKARMEESNQGRFWSQSGQIISRSSRFIQFDSVSPLLIAISLRKFSVDTPQTRNGIPSRNKCGHLFSGVLAQIELSL